MKCKDCKYYRRLKHNFKVGKGFEESNCCIAILIMDKIETGNNLKAWVQEVEPNSFCEMFEQRRELQ